MTRIKTCSRCKVEGPFGASKDRIDGLDSICKKCRKAYSEIPENKQRQKKWRDDHREHIRKHNILARFGLTPDSYDELVRKQEGRCAICRLKLDFVSFKKVVETPHVDHCHITDKVRGILCTRCNIMLGMSCDNINVLLLGAKYLLSSLPAEISGRVVDAVHVLNKEIDEAIESAIQVDSIRQDEDDRICMQVGSLSEEEAENFWAQHAQYEALLEARNSKAHGLKIKTVRKYSRGKGKFADIQVKGL